MRSGKVEGIEYCYAPVVLPESWLFPRSELTVQLVDPSYVYGDRHLLVSIYAHLKGFRLARDSPMNLLLRLTGQSQIKEALEAKPGREAVLVVVGKGAKTEFTRLLKAGGAEETGEVPSREGELDAAERSALAGL